MGLCGVATGQNWFGVGVGVPAGGGPSELPLPLRRDFVSRCRLDLNLDVRIEVPCRVALCLFEGSDDFDELKVGDFYSNNFGLCWCYVCPLQKFYFILTVTFRG